ncbi:uncharacterized protein LOC109858556 isoform X2 [Pseudomyrmex gracilis]|uniref:uncharacterized protein LOC109858556 isoform X2 n=1 Tax=Pseudomyrmex gracilis TaxID=219809 RepID=UPI0009952145|nr:uncharacterized protein LOC109858556 isoform X2 [Pseudomyrmex gracilis]
MDMKKWAETRAERTCRFCNKVFCCVKCRNRHTIEKHLPLRCQLCSDLFESLEDLQSIGACKWKSQHWSFISPTGFQLQKSNQCLLSDIDDSRFITPSEILRKTSTPMLVGQKTSFEYHTPCVPNFSLKTPKSNSLSITQSNAKSSSQHINTGDTDFFSAIDNITPILISKSEFSNSVKNLDIMEEQNEDVNKINTKIVADENRVSSTINTDLTCSNVDVVLQDSLASDVTRERLCRALDVVKKVRFSDQFNSLTEMESLKESHMRDTSMEEEFYDAHDINIRNTKNTEKDKEETTESAKTIEDKQNTENTKNSHEQRKCSLLEQPLENSSANSNIKIILNNTSNTQKDDQIFDNTTKTQKENQNPNKKISTSDSSVTNQQSSNRMLMMVVMENNSGMLSTDLVPLISSSLQKLHEQLASTSCQSCPSVTESLDSGNVRRRSILKMEMSVSTVDTYLVNKEKLTTHQEVLSSSSLPVQKCESNNNGGFLTAVAQAMKHAFKSFSILSNPTRRSIRGTEVVEQQKIITKSTTSQEVTDDQVSTSSVNNQTRPGKRNREVSEPTTRMDSRTPLAKRHKAWYTMIKGRQPIDRMRESRVSKSPRGVSTETQVFSQGSLTVRDTIIPLPTRAHQSSQTE